WLRGMLAEHGVDPASVTWTAFEEPHVAEFVDPPSVRAAPPGATLSGMLLAGEIDAAILGEPVDDPRIRPVFEDPKAAAADWQREHGGALQINHMVVVKEALAREHPDAVREVWRLLVA